MWRHYMCLKACSHVCAKCSLISRSDCADSRFPMALQHAHKDALCLLLSMYVAVYICVCVCVTMMSDEWWVCVWCPQALVKPLDEKCSDKSPRPLRFCRFCLSLCKSEWSSGPLFLLSMCVHDYDYDIGRFLINAAAESARNLLHNITAASL